MLSMIKEMILFNRKHGFILNSPIVATDNHKTLRERSQKEDSCPLMLYPLTWKQENAWTVKQTSIS